uniref:tRNA modification GTPase MnmE n=1 Tax=candidate division WOR-3 bacterium TaxID=2052148 RepID=A0A7C4TE51_UNCW3
MSDTIIACATPTGHSSIAVIRISGDNAVSLIKKVFVPSTDSYDFLPNRVYYGKVVASDTKDTIDYVLVTFFFAPHSYTGEDVVEISCHGNPLIVQKIIEIFINLGARLAQPGEFTRRALLNNKIDLIQAEAILETVNAPCDEGRKLAIYQLEGKLSAVLNEISSEIVDLLTVLEASIDFPEEEEIHFDKNVVIKKIKEITEKVDLLLKGASQGLKLKNGYRVVIAGRQNVGKSTLFNRLVGYDRAIVHETPGTTRDFIEEEIEIGGILIRLVDTAGVFLEGFGPDKIASSRSEELLKKADLVLLTFDGSEPMNEQDAYLYNFAKNLNKILVINKIDLNFNLRDSEILSDAVKVSAKTGDNIELLKENIKNRLFPKADREDVLITRERHIQGLKDFRQCLDNIQSEQTPEIIAFELHNCLDILGELTGKILREDILNRIFEEFCIGK